MKRTYLTMLAIVAAAASMVIAVIGCGDDNDASSAALLYVCSADSDCEDGLQCLHSVEMGTGGFCSKSCDSAADCPSNAHCYIWDQGEGHFCTPYCSSNDDCSVINAAMNCAERTSSDPDYICVGN